MNFRSYISPASLCCVLSLAFFTGSVARLSADETKTVKVVRWSELAAAGKLLAGEVAQEAEVPGALVVRVPAEGPPLVKLCVIDEPGVGAPAYVLRGKVRCDGVNEPGFLEMWNHFPDGGAYFTRTLGEAGPMGKLQGTQAWRELALPFTITQPGQVIDAAPRPSRLELNVVLPRGGTVYLSDLEVAQFVGAGTTTQSQAATAAAVLLGVQMLLVLALGLLAGFQMLSPAWTVKLAWALAVVSALSVAGGILATASNASRPVQLQLLIAGLAGLTASGILIPGLRRKSHERELRQMQALDV